MDEEEYHDVFAGNGGLVCPGCCCHCFLAAEPPRISKEELQAMLGNPDLVIIDDRTGSDWTASEFKIKGAVREDPDKVDAWMDKYSKDKTLVFY